MPEVPDRPDPPRELRHAETGVRPAPELVDWVRGAFLEDGAPLTNDDHDHLQWARFGAVWTADEYRRKGRLVVGMAETGDGREQKWKRARLDQQLSDWFGTPLPDFLLTFYAPVVAKYDDAQWCALVEHELYHCAQDTDKKGQPAFGQDGRPKYTIRGHDVEEFVGVVRRYGAEAAGPGVERMVEAARSDPEVAADSIASACGTCLKRAA